MNSQHPIPYQTNRKPISYHNPCMFSISWRDASAQFDEISDEISDVG